MVASTDPPSAKAFQTKLSVGNSFSLIGAHFLRKVYTTSLLETPPPPPPQKIFANFQIFPIKREGLVK